jgi:peptide deformylase
LRVRIREPALFGKTSNDRLGRKTTLVYLRTMTLRKIAPLGQPVLLRRAVAVLDPTDATTRALIQDMVETLADARGLGLAAPQVYAGVRLILAHLPDADGVVDRTATPLVLVNPKLTPLDDATDTGFEGCLSIPGLRGIVRRFERVGLEALDGAGRPVEREALGLFARILQHEVDHLDGILYTHRLEDPRHLAFDGEVQALTAYLAEHEPEAGSETSDD